MYLIIFLFAGMENDVSDLHTRERGRERERDFVFDLQNLVVTLANACHEIISNLRVTAFTLNTFVQTLISLAHAHAANKNIISCILTQHNQHNGQWYQISFNFVIAKVMKKYDKKRIFYPPCHM